MRKTIQVAGTAPRGFGRQLRFVAARAATVASLAAMGSMLGAVFAGATTKDETLALCERAMTEGEGATSLADVDYRRHDGIPFVYGDATFADGARAHYRCRVYKERVTSVRYLVGDPAYSGARAWSAHRPMGTDHGDLYLDEVAKSAPAPAAEFEPHFERVPDGSK